MKEPGKDAAKTDLKALYKKLDADKKMTKLKAIEFILEANKIVGLDDILLREGF
jgi:Skp family chaperone for outer membrane proteins